MAESYYFCGYSESSGFPSSSQICQLAQELVDYGYSISDSSPISQSLSYLGKDSEDSEKCFLEYPQSFSEGLSLCFEKPSLEVFVAFGLDSQAIWSVDINVDTLWGLHRNLEVTNTLTFIETIEIALQVLTPHFGCFFNGTKDIPDYPLSSDFQANKLYEINFYSDALIAKQFNQNLLLTSPAWRVKKCANGILLIPSIEGIYSGRQQNFKNVARHLGLLK